MTTRFPTYVEGCDAPDPKPVYTKSSGVGFECRCLVCGNCGKHTGNSNQGHYTAFCRVATRFHDQHNTKNPMFNCSKCMIEFHFCCPNNCQIFTEDGERR